MKELLLRSALVGVVCAGAASRAFAFWALAYKGATGVAGGNWNNSTLEGAETAALKRCPGGRVLSTGDTRGFYAVVGKRLA
jgi:hypothetical protein